MFWQKYYKLKIVQTENDLAEFRQAFLKSNTVYFDTETSGLMVRAKGRDYSVGYTFAFNDESTKTVYYVPLEHEFEGKYEEDDRFAFLHAVPKTADGTPLINRFPDFCPEKFEGEWHNIDKEFFIKFLSDLIFSARRTYVAHNIIFDLHTMQTDGIDVRRIFRTQDIFDTQLAIHSIDEDMEKKLEKVVYGFFNVYKADYDMTVATVTAKEKKSVGLKSTNKANFQHVQIPIGAYYSGEDVWFMKQMTDSIKEALASEEQEEFYYKYRIPHLISVWEMEREGAFVDKARLEQMKIDVNKELADLTYKMYELVGTEFNINSSDQLNTLLFSHKKCRRKMENKKWTGEYTYSYIEELYDLSFGFPVMEWTDGGKERDKNCRSPKSGREELEELQSQKCTRRPVEEGRELLRLLIVYKKLEKLRSAFIEGIPELIYDDGRVHPSFNITGTVTYRLSCDSPNLQQLPRPVEEPKEPKRENFDTDEAFNMVYEQYVYDKKEYDFWVRFEIRDVICVPDEDTVLIAGDWSNLEKRISTYFSKDSALERLFNEDLDGHGLIATMIFPEISDMHPNQVKKKRPDLRNIAKTVGFALDYGGTEYTISKKLGISKQEALGYIDSYYKGFKGLAQFMKNQQRDARNQLYLKTILGHKRHIPGINSEDFRLKGYAERTANNSPIQGSGADTAIVAQIDVCNDPVMKACNFRLIAQIHDELVGYCDKKYEEVCKARLKYLMEVCLEKRGIKMQIPFISNVDSGTTYSEAK